ncbi:hypothetical protein BpHYR1_048378 [Brachionus plicatilis]|uniref:Uncharacterized protein n=1 Tax=Brachionus plicatilis TaxID=10195 RepID=A0A3M7QG87_BRAPC|nr:hypothetical protein BpHYR1_048378 [Brachionus plicatilis]
MRSHASSVLPMFELGAELELDCELILGVRLGLTGGRAEYILFWAESFEMFSEVVNKSECLSLIDKLC